MNHVLIIGNSFVTHEIVTWLSSQNCSWRVISPIVESKSPHIEFCDSRHFHDTSFDFSPPAYLTVLPPEIFHTEQLQQWFIDQQWFPEWIINLTDNVDFQTVEYRIGQWFHCKNAITDAQLDFYNSKQTQDQTCKQLGIPTFPATSDAGLCVKRAFKTWNFTSTTVPKFRWEPTTYQPTEFEFAQGWQDIEYDYSLNITIDSAGTWTVWDINKRYSSHGVVTHEVNPSIPSDDEKQQIREILLRLKTRLNANCRILNYQLAKRRGDSTLYSMDFNARINGDYYIKGASSSLIPFNPWLSLWNAQTIPDTLQFSNQFFGETAYSYHHRTTGQELRPIPLNKMRWWVDPTVSWAWKIGSSHVVDTTIRV